MGEGRDPALGLVGPRRGQKDADHEIIEAEGGVGLRQADVGLTEPGQSPALDILGGQVDLLVELPTAPPAAAPAMPSPSWSPGSTEKGWRRCSPATGAARPPA